MFEIRQATSADVEAIGRLNQFVHTLHVEAHPDIFLGAEGRYTRPTALGWYHAIDAHLHKLGIEHVPYEQLEGGKLKIITDF